MQKIEGHVGFHNDTRLTGRPGARPEWNDWPRHALAPVRDDYRPRRCTVKHRLAIVAAAALLLVSLCWHDLTRARAQSASPPAGPAAKAYVGLFKDNAVAVIDTV